MNVETGAEAVQFPGKEYIIGIANTGKPGQILMIKIHVLVRQSLRFSQPPLKVQRILNQMKEIQYLDL